MTYWQIASGDKTRDYSEVCFNFGIVCVGPGKPGIMSDETMPEYEKLGEWNKIKPMLEVNEGDRIVLKSGRSLIQSVGEVVRYNNKIYNYSDCFKDIDGWDLQHFIKVKWKDFSIRFENSTELHRATMARLHKEEVIKRIEEEWEGSKFIEDRYSIPEKPTIKEIEYRELEEALINYGFRISDAENTSRTIEQVEKLANWYLKNQISSTEHEIRTFLVIPFLQALGWSPQKIGIEVTTDKGKIDIMLYNDNKRENPKIVVETKKMWDGSAQAINQAKRYMSASIDLQKVIRFVVTDGLRYWLYERNSNNNWNPIAYMNFNNKMKDYPSYPNCEGMFGFIKKLIG